MPRPDWAGRGYGHRVRPEELARIYGERIAPDLFIGAAAEPNPVLVLVGGPPGAGKSASIERLRELCPAQTLVPVVGDDFRRYHPGYAATLARDPTAMPMVTAAAASAWTHRAISDGIERGYSLTVEGTWRDAAVPLATARHAHAAGYSITAATIAVPEPISLVATLSRYYNAVNAKEDPRWTPIQAHDQAVAALPGSVRALAGADEIDRMLVLDRQGHIHYDSGPGGPGSDGYGGNTPVGRTTT